MAQFLRHHHATPELGRRRSDLCRSSLHAGNLPDLSFQEWRPQGGFQPHRRAFFSPAARNRHQTSGRKQPSGVGNAAFGLQDVQACYICTRLLRANPTCHVLRCNRSKCLRSYSVKTEWLLGVHSSSISLAKTRLPRRLTKTSTSGKGIIGGSQRSGHMLTSIAYT